MPCNIFICFLLIYQYIPKDINYTPTHSLKIIQTFQRSMIYQMNTLGKSTLSKQYYFQMLPVQLIFKKPQQIHPQVEPSRMHNYKLTVHKGIQKFDENRVPVSVFCGSTETSVKFEKSHMLCFYLPIFNANRQVFFTIKIHSDPYQQRVFQQVGSFQFDSNAYVNQFNEQDRKIYQETVDISENFALSFQLYIEHTRIELEKLLKNKHPEFFFIQTDKSDTLSNSSKGKVVSAFGGKQAMISPKKYLSRKQQGSDRQRKILTRQGSQQNISGISYNQDFGQARRSQRFGGSNIMQSTKPQDKPISPAFQSQIADIQQTQQKPNLYNPRDKYTPNINRYQRPSKAENTNTSYELKRQTKNNSDINIQEISQSYEIKKESPKVEVSKGQTIKRFTSYQRKNIYNKNIGSYTYSRGSQTLETQPQKQQSKNIQEPYKEIQQTFKQEKKQQSDLLKQSEDLSELPKQLPEMTPHNTQNQIQDEKIEQQKQTIAENNKAKQYVDIPQISNQFDLRTIQEVSSNIVTTSEIKHYQISNNLQLNIDVQQIQIQNVRDQVQDNNWQTEPVDRVSVQDTVGTQFRQENIQQTQIQRVEQRNQYQTHKHSYSVHGDTPEVVEVGINQRAYQVRVIQEANRQEENTSQRETDTQEHQAFQQQDKLNRRSDYSQRNLNHHIKYRRNISVEAVPSQSGKDFQEDAQFNIKRENQIQQQIQSERVREESVQNKQEIIDVPQMDSPGSIQNAQRIEQFEQENIQYRIQINLSQEKIEEKQKYFNQQNNIQEQFQSNQTPETQKETQSVQFNLNNQQENQATNNFEQSIERQSSSVNNFMDQQAKQSITFSVQDYKTIYKQKSEQNSHIFEKSNITCQITSQNLQFDIQEKAYDKIIINQQQSMGRQNPILINNDEVLTPEQRQQILNIDLLDGQSPVKVQVGYDSNEPATFYSLDQKNIWEARNKEQEQLLMRSNDLEQLRQKQIQQQECLKQLRRTNSETMLTKSDIQSKKQQLKRRKEREYGVGSLIILILVGIMTYFFLTQDGTKYTGRRTRSYRAKKAN